MSLEAQLQPVRQEIRPGDPIHATLLLKNNGAAKVFLFVPSTRDGIELAILKNGGLSINPRTEDPDAGLVPEIKIDPGEIYRKQYLLSNWITVREAGHFRVGCSIEVQMSDRSLRDSQKGTQEKVRFNLQIDLIVLPE